MTLIYFIVAGAVAILACAGWWFWRRRQRQSARMISFVALLREPVSYDPVVLARVAGKAWDADLGDGETEGEDGFAVGAGPLNSIMCRGRIYLVNCLPNPYVEDPEEAAEGIVDLRLRQLFAEHRAWLSCDAMGADHDTPDDEIREHYRLLGKLLIEFLDDNCLMIFVPEIGRGYAVNEETEKALKSDDPLAALQGSSTVPLIPVADDDPAMIAAVADARQNWSRFVAAYERQAGGNFSVKAPVSHGGVTEYIWLSVTALEGDRIFGELANDPCNLGPLKLGSKVSVSVAELNDWCFMDAQGEIQGAYTVAAVTEAARRQQKG